MSFSRKVIPSPIGRLKLIASDEGLAAILWDNDRPIPAHLADSVENPTHPTLLRAEKELNERAEAWRPWRAYAAHYLWQSSGVTP